MITFPSFTAGTFKYISRVGQNHLYTVYNRYVGQGTHQIYGHIRCIYTVLANPVYIIYICHRQLCDLTHIQATAFNTHTNTHTVAVTFVETDSEIQAQQQKIKNLPSCGCLCVLNTSRMLYLIEHIFEHTCCLCVRCNNNRFLCVGCTYVYPLLISIIPFLIVFVHYLIRSICHLHWILCKSGPNANDKSTYSDCEQTQCLTSSVMARIPNPDGLTHSPYQFYLWSSPLPI
jgi:hypothetical protein